MNGIRIGELARRTACPIDTIRYYEGQGLLRHPERSKGNFRLYAEADVERLTFIRHCRTLDMSLAEIATLLSIRDHPEADCEEVIELIDEHCGAVARRIAELQSLERYLNELRTCCHPGVAARDCGILRELAHVPEEATVTDAAPATA